MIKYTLGDKREYDLNRARIFPREGKDKSKGGSESKTKKVHR